MKEKFLQFLGGILGIALVIGLIGWGISAQKKHDEEYPWLGTFYMYGDVEGDNNELKTLEECRAWAFDRAEDKGLKEGDWDYNCGTGCEYTDGKIENGQKVKTYSCAETTK